MSIVLAVEKGGEIAIASDSLTSDGSGEIFQVRQQKIHHIGCAYISQTGEAVLATIIQDYIHKENIVSYDPQNERDVYNFFLDFRQALTKTYGLVDEQPYKDRQNTPFINWNQYFLTVSPSGIFYTEGNLGTVRISRFMAIGCGGPYALGWLECAWQNHTGSALALATEACQAACKYDVHCGGEIVGYVCKKREEVWQKS